MSKSTLRKRKYRAGNQVLKSLIDETLGNNINNDLIEDIFCQQTTHCTIDSVSSFCSLITNDNKTTIIATGDDISTSCDVGNNSSDSSDESSSLSGDEDNQGLGQGIKYISKMFLSPLANL